MREELPDWLSLRNLFLTFFLLFNITDVISTWVVARAHPQAFNEINPVYILTKNMLTVHIVKFALMIFLLYWMIKKYPLIKGSIARYINVYGFVLVTFLLLAVTINNFEVATLPSSEVQPMPDSVKLQALKEEVGSLRALENLTPKKKGIPLLPVLMFLNLIQFMTYQSFEKHRRTKATDVSFWRG